MYHKKHKYDLIIIFAIFTLCISLFLAVSEALKISVPCDLTGGCEVVLNSKYANFLGLPLPYLGIVFSGVIIIASLLANHYNRLRILLTYFLGIGALISLTLLVIQFFVLKSVCQYCLILDLLVITMFLWDMHIQKEMP
ncbi:MAG: vitamin K epoxide reductase family protein [Patescibacteria group bacterium]